MKKTFTLALITTFFFQTKNFAQFNAVWNANYQNTTANNYSNESRKVVLDASGNSYVLADATSNLDPSGVPGTTTWHYTVLTKYSPSGGLLVTRLLNVFNHFVTGYDNKGAYGLAIDATGNLYVGFSTYDAVTGFDANIAKYNTNLVRLWNHSFNPTSTDRGVDLAISSGGDAYAIVESTTGANVTYNFIKANAQLVTATPFYSLVTNTDVMYRVIVANNNVYATGYRVISGFKNVLTVKINNLGILKWQRTYNGGSVARDDFGRNLTMGADGYIYVTGTSDQGVPTGNDVIIMKLQDTNGSKLWARYKDFNHSLTDAGYFVDASDMNYVYAGSTSGNTILLERLETALGNSGGRVNYVPTPSAAFSNITGVALTDMRVSTNFGFYLTGNVQATDMSSQTFSAAFLVKFVVQAAARSTFKVDAEMPVSGDFSTSKTASCIALDYFKDDVYWLRDFYSNALNHQQETVVLTDIDMVSAIRAGNTMENNPAGDIFISPNPTHSFISLSMAEKIKKIELFNMTGRLVKTYNVLSENVELNLSELANGIYIGRIYSESGQSTSRKIIKN